MAKNYNRRQRKKLHLVEFQELGFAVEAQLPEAWSAEQKEALLDAFIDLIETNGMLAAASTSSGFDAFVVSGAPRESTTEAQRATVSAWLDAQNELTGVVVGELVDAWYPSIEWA